MKRETFNEWLRVTKIMDKSGIGKSVLALIFEDQTLEGLVFKNEVGYAAVGYSEGRGIVVDFKGFCVVASFIDIISARKSIDSQFIEFRSGDKKSRLHIEEVMEVNLPVWKSGEVISIRSDDVFSVGKEINYYIAGGGFCFGCIGFFGLRKVDLEKEINMQLSYIFIEVFEGSIFDKFVIEENSISLSKDDLEVFLFSSVEESVGSLVERFNREIKVIKDERKIEIKDRGKVKEILEALREMRNLGASSINVEIVGKLVVLSSVVGAELVRSIEIDGTGKFDGCLGNEVLDMLKVVGDKIHGIYADDVMFLFDGDISVIANVLGEVR